MKKKEIIRHLEMLNHDQTEAGAIFPFRDNPTISKLLSSTAEVVGFCQSYDQNANIYISVNQRNKVNSRKKDIENVNFVVVDIDAVRADSNNQSSNQSELDKTIEVAELIVNWFVENGFQSPMRAISGNGCHLWVKIPPVELTSPQVTTEWESKVKQFYRQIESLIPKDLARKVIIDSIQDVT